jgi:2'-5' RNA ligase
VRLFVAINLPDSEKERLYNSISPLRAGRFPVRWVASPSLHITLKFLGEVPEHESRPVKDALNAAAACCSPFLLKLHGIGAFPNLRRPRVVWMGADPAPELLRLQAEMEAHLSELGFERETRPFSPHLTLGRAEMNARASDFAALESVAARIDCRSETSITTVDLMLSELNRTGARYSVISAAALAGQSAPS